MKKIQIIAVANQKGDVWKTTTGVNLKASLARSVKWSTCIRFDSLKMFFGVFIEEKFR